MSDSGDELLFNRLVDACQAAGSQRKFALAHGLDRSYVCAVLHGRTRGYSEKLLRALGLERQERIVRAKE